MTRNLPRNEAPVRILYSVVGFALTAILFVIPVGAAAQAIGGTVTDATGGVVPGVTIEARSPVLIEQVRTAVTDGAGEYLITALLSGDYTVTFGLVGFSTVVREGVRLHAGFTAPIDAQLDVGSIQEAITVTATSPVVDVRGVSQRRSLDREIIDTVPSGKSYQGLATLIPGMVVGQAFASAAGTGIDIGGQAGDSQARLSMHGSLEQDQQIEVDGLPVGNAARGSWSLVHLADGNYAEYDFSYAANAPEVQTGGVRLNMIPRDGGNAFTGRVFASGSTQGLQADNIDEDLIARGLPAGSQNRLSELWSVNPSRSVVRSSVTACGFTWATPRR